MDAIVAWGSRYCLPEWVITDGGPHFSNTAMTEVTKRLGIDQHITLAYAPWSNGAVQRVGRELLWTLRCSLEEIYIEILNVTDLDLLVPLLQFILNHRRLVCLGGKSAFL